MSKENTLHISELQFPKIPENANQEMRDYLLELERMLREALKGSLYVNQTFENGIFGN